jgi:hypothetical protein
MAIARGVVAILCADYLCSSQEQRGPELGPALVKANG